MTAIALRRPAMAAPRPVSIARWLLVVAALVFGMVVVGGITRLTESGLSITQWKPITGAIPPLTHDQWTRSACISRSPNISSCGRA
jgi:cytochrome c oxidase assembly protein subunit 15